MQIRAGFEIAYDCPQPTPMLLVLSVHPSRMPDLIGAAPDRLRPADRRHRLPRQLRQHLHPHPGPGRPADDVAPTS